MRYLFLALIFAGVPSPLKAAEQVFQIRDFTYVFSSSTPRAVGPWHVLKFDFASTTRDSTVYVRFVTGNRDDSSAPAHGEYFRIEDQQRISRTFTVVGGLGAGSGYQPLHTATLELVARPLPRATVGIALGTELSALTSSIFQRVVAFGPSFTSGSISGYARYYRAYVSGATPRLVPTGAFNIGWRANAKLNVNAVVNIGGEVGGDRTASQLPTSSGRYGTDAGAGMQYTLSRTLAATVFYERARYYQAPSGRFARNQAVLAFGLLVRK